MVEVLTLLMRTSFSLFKSRARLEAENPPAALEAAHVRLWGHDNSGASGRSAAGDAAPGIRRSRRVEGAWRMGGTPA
jgi:hypothetical protein